MDLSTTYLGFKLATPIIPGASPMCDDIGKVKRLEDAGAPMIVMHSIFQEQLVYEETAVNLGIDLAENSFAEALTHLPKPEEFQLGPDEYLEQVSLIKQAVSIPVVASMNGRALGWWTKYAQYIEQAGADAIELNIYDPVLDPEVSSSEVERRIIDLVSEIRKTVKLPLAVKLSLNYTALGNFAKHLHAAGANALVLFNRFFQADIDIEHLDLRRELMPSTSAELLPRLRAVASLWGRVKMDLAVTGGVHTATDVVKSIMAGANAVQMVTALLEYGPAYLTELHRELAMWLEAHEYESLSQMRGSMSLLRTPNRAAFERGNYMKIINSWERT
ncbi:MAG TPA: dihydroorotate dehydrogenase-like protein [Tepidisphaeraceae bacterium]|nr:dihydroorotate dehydrogenase-like protein [Tepidisphaeraceae bacterium]